MNNLWNRHSLLAGVLIFITLVAYIPAIQGGFVWDDNDHLTENQTIRSLQGLGQIWFAPKSNYLYYPMTFSSFWLEYRLWGLNPTGYHVVNVLLHALSALLLYRILLCLNLPGAWLAAAVFALHPVHVESVAWVSERKNVLSGFFYFASALCLFRFFGFTGKREKKPNLWWYLAGLLLFICALFSKTVTCSLPAAMLLVLWWKRGGVKGGEVAALAPFFALGLAMGLTTAWLEKHQVGALGSEWDLSFVESCLLAGRALWFYLGKLILPVKLIFNYPRWQVDGSLWWQYIYPAGVLLVVFILWLIRRRIGRGPLVAVLFFCGTLLPALGFFDVYIFRYSFVADHFQYLASVGLIALLIGVATKLASRLPKWPQRSFSAVGLIVLLLLGGQTWHQGYVYRDMETLWNDTIAKNPRSWLALNGLGVVLAEQGKFQEAIFHYSQALEVKPDHYKAHNNLGNALARLGRYEEAMNHYKESLRLRPDYAEAHSNLGNVLASQGKFQEAIYHYSEALRSEPDYVEAHINLANVLASQGKFDEAMNHYEEALRLKPDYAEAHYNLGNVLAVQGRFQEAIRHYKEVLRLKPYHAEAHNNLGNLLEAQGKFREAADHYAQVVRLKPDYAEAHNNLANALASQGKFAQAIDHYTEALRLKPDNAEAHNNLANVLAGQGKFEEAIGHYEEALRLKPDYVAARKNLDLVLQLKGK
ncbi:MAG: tetratricopeptide repeat protein [Deltaproteobacteria bacterium]|nr:tetratricopeptide repeat protein [Deltaproteobacteria bacterium]